MHAFSSLQDKCHSSSKHYPSRLPSLTPALFIHVCKKGSFKGRYEYHIPLPVTVAHSWSAADMPTSSAAVPPLPTQLLCKHTQHTHTAELNSAQTKEIRCCWQPQSHHLRKRQRSCFYDVGNRLSSDEDRSMEKTDCSFWIKHLLGFLHYYPSIPLFHLNKRFEHVLVGYISLSPSSLANHWKINQ